jgi:hypothetical protein
MRSTARGALVALILLLASSAPAFADTDRPMLGQFSLTGVPADPRCGPDALTLGFTGVGNATHLGSIFGNATNCTEFTLGTEAVDIWDGLATFVAADGSTLTTAYAGIQQAPVAGIASVETTHTVLGGTGRFAGATGLWTLRGEVDFTSGTSDGSIAGWIRY